MSARSAMARPLAVFFPAMTAMHLDAAGGELLGDAVGGAPLLEGELGMRVQVAAQLAQLAVVAADALDRCAHGASRRRRGSTA